MHPKMTSSAPMMKRINVFDRWWPLGLSEPTQSEIFCSRGSLNGRSQLSVSSSQQLLGPDPSRTSPSALKAVFVAEYDNSRVYDTIVTPAILQALRGGTCNFSTSGSYRQRQEVHHPWS